MARVYSIATLLKLGQMKLPAHIELRVNPAALTESIFRFASSGLRSKQHESLRHRVQTQSSHVTGRSTRSEEEAIYDGSFARPLRQPINPPEASLIQKHAGFARFLKQHASPPHHRVTAGGRIVPAGPLSPPPMMLLPSINAVVTNPSSKAYSRNTQGDLAEPSKKSVGMTRYPDIPFMAPLAHQSANFNTQNFVSNSQTVGEGVDSQGNAQNPQLSLPLVNAMGASLGPLPVGATPIGFLPDGSPLVFFNGMNYQSFWDGNSTILKPLQLPMPGSLQAAFQPTAYPQINVESQYPQLYVSNNSAHPQGFNFPNNFPDGLNYGQEQALELNIAESEDPQILHDRLRSDLTILDKYVALHLHEFSPAESLRCTSHRRQLVEQLDSLRTNKENQWPSNSAMGIVSSSQALASFSVPNEAVQYPGGHCEDTTENKKPTSFGPIAATSAFPSGQTSRPGLKGKLGPPKTPTSKTLSPDARPFIPANVKAPAPDYFNITPKSDSNNAQLWLRQGANGKHHSARGYVLTENRDYVSRSTQVSASLRGNPRGGNTNVHSTDKQSVVGYEPSTANALPTVTLVDIEYATAPGFNPSGGAKLYCTTVAEFQEVLRRVREQAQMYGCKGGQSKDPAYDAEQDIRWAMADNEPIPLPKSPADHVANPRPWSWDDSAFNHRPSFAASPTWTGPTWNENNAKLTVNHSCDEEPIQVTVRPSRPRADSWDTDPDLAIFTRPRKDSIQVINEHIRHVFYSANGCLQSPSHAEDGRKSLERFSASSTSVPHRAGVPKQITSSQLPSVSLGHAMILSEHSRTPFQTKRRDSWESNSSWPSVASQERKSGVHRAYNQAVPPIQRKFENASVQRSEPAALGLISVSGSNDNSDAESDALSFDSQGIPHSGLNNSGPLSHDKHKAAKVNLPPTSSKSTLKKSQGATKSKDHQVRDLRGVDFTRVPHDNTSQGFLRGMLKSPRYSAARIHQSEPFDSFSYKVQANSHSQYEPMNDSANKENIKSEDLQTNWVGYAKMPEKGTYALSRPSQSVDEGSVINKAQSSLAASRYHAIGRLPQYDGAGEALKSNSRPVRPTNSLGDGSSARREGEKCTDVGSVRDQKAPRASSRREQAASYDVGPTDNYDYRGLTRNIFSHAPDRPLDRRMHHQQIDRYFDRLREEEFQESDAQRGRAAAV
ncbi:MAG: hypothetical protein Q9222_000620 [Ikaeria aurantiellina]